MPSIPQSLLWISLVVLWLFVLVPMLISKRDAVRRTSDVALATRVLNGGSASRLLRRKGPAAGHRTDPDWKPQESDLDDLDGTDQDEHSEEDDADERPTHPVVMQFEVPEQTEPDYLDVDVIEDSGALPAGASEAKTEPVLEADETETETEPVAREAEREHPDRFGDEYEYIEDSSGLEPDEDDDDALDDGTAPPVAPAASRRRRFDEKTAAAVSARKYTFRKRVLMVMAVVLVGSATAAFEVTPTAWWVCSIATGRHGALPGVPAPANPDRGEGASSPDAPDGTGTAWRGERRGPRIRRGPLTAAAPGRGGPRDRRRGPDLRASRLRHPGARLRLAPRPAAGRRRVAATGGAGAVGFVELVACYRSGAMAQLVARLVRIEKVRGSNPLSSTGKVQLRSICQGCVGNNVTIDVTSGVMASIHAQKNRAGNT